MPDVITDDRLSHDAATRRRFRQQFELQPDGIGSGAAGCLIIRRADNKPVAEVDFIACHGCELMTILYFGTGQNRKEQWYEGPTDSTANYSGNTQLRMMRDVLNEYGEK